MKTKLSGTMKRALAGMLALAALALLCGCSPVENALRQAGQNLSRNDVSTPQSVDPDADWSWLPPLRERATQMFTQAAPTAVVDNVIVTTSSVTRKRVIVVIEYTLEGKSGSYGFDYTLSDEGEYVLKRYGEGVETSDIK